MGNVEITNNYGTISHKSGRWQPCLRQIIPLHVQTAKFPYSVWQIMERYIYGTLAVLSSDFVSHVGAINMIDSSNFGTGPGPDRASALDNCLCDSYLLDWGSKEPCPGLRSLVY